MNWLMEKLPEATRSRVRTIYESKFKLNPNEVFRDGTKRQIKTELEVERFYRKITCKSDKISTIGNVRP